MSRNKLPPLFAKYRFGLAPALRPRLILNIPEAEMRRHDAWLKSFKDDADRMIQVAFFDSWWIETEGMAVLVHTTLDAMTLQHRVQGFYRHHTTPAFRMKYDYFDANNLMPPDLPTDTSEKFEAILFLKSTAVVKWWTEQPAEPSVNTLTRNTPSAHAREGDTFRYARLDDLRTVAGQSMQRDYQPPAEPSGIRKREHQVRGFWRHYRSGVKAWVKPHLRGDPELGRCTRIIGP